MFKTIFRKRKLAIFGVCFGLLLSPMVALSQISTQAPVVTEAADYSGVGAGFSRTSDGTIKATFSVTNNNLDMRGWLLCLFSSQPSVGSDNKLTNSDDAHPYSYSSCSYYFFASNTTKTGSITVTFNANSADQKKHWSASSSTHTTDNLKNAFESQSLWYLVIGPRHYETSWGDSGIGAGTNGYWENCDYYVGKSSEVFPTDKNMSVSVTNYQGTYTPNASRTITINVSDPSSGYTIKYRTASSGSYNLTTKPSYTDAGNYTIYFQITKSGYNPYEGSGTVKISKANPTYSPPTAISGLVYNGNNQALINAGSSSTSTIQYSLDGSSYSNNVPTGKNAGEYTVYYKVVENTNYKGVNPTTIKVSIAKADPVYTTVPEAIIGLKYTSENQALITAGLSTGGTVLYSLDGSSYSTAIPEKKLVGEYTVFYKIQGDSNYNDVEANSFNVSISPNDKTALNAEISIANNYLNNISSTYPAIANQLNNAITLAQEVSDEVNKTVAEIATSKEELEYAYDLAHAEVCDELIDNIGEVRLTDKCLSDIKKAENAYASLTKDQKDLVNNLSDLNNARELYDKLETVREAINAIGEVTYDNDCYNRILDAKEAYDTLNADEKKLIPTLFNELTSAEDIYDVLKLIANLGEVEYNEEYLQKLQTARYAYDALDKNEQSSVSNYDDLKNAEYIYTSVDNVVKLVNDIPEDLEYVGTHNPNIDGAREAYNELSEEEKALVPQLVVTALETAEEEYEELKVEHERKEIEDRESGVVIVTEGGSGIPNTVSIDIGNSSSSDKDFEDNIDYQTITDTLPEDEVVSSICEIKFYEEREGEVVELSLADIDEDMSLVIKIDVPADIDDSNFKIVLLDKDNNLVEMDYDYDPETRQATVVTTEIGTFAILTPVVAPSVATSGLWWSILLIILVALTIIGLTIYSIRKATKKEN